MSTTAPKSKAMSPSRAAGGRSVKGSKSSASKSKTKAAPAKSKTTSANAANKDGGKRLSPGSLDGLVLGYMKKHKGDLPISPTTVAHAIKRSSGAVGNCLGRLERAEKVRLVEKKPRRYDLAPNTK